ncbi:MAG: palindromic element RPE4 domain-containing protein [Rickettsia conorii subsp. raoultii]
MLIFFLDTVVKPRYDIE